MQTLQSNSTEAKKRQSSLRLTKSADGLTLMIPRPGRVLPTPAQAATRLAQGQESGSSSSGVQFATKPPAELTPGTIRVAQRVSKPEPAYYESDSEDEDDSYYLDLEARARDAALRPPAPPLSKFALSVQALLEEHRAAIRLLKEKNAPKQDSAVEQVPK